MDNSLKDELSHEPNSWSTIKQAYPRESHKPLPFININAMSIRFALDWGVMLSDEIEYLDLL